MKTKLKVFNTIDFFIKNYYKHEFKEFPENLFYRI